jgi:hypothetical protein
MRASTAILLAVLLSSVVAEAGWAAESLPRVGIAPFVHEVPNIRMGLAQVFSHELVGNGRMRVVSPRVCALILASHNDLDRAFSEGLSNEQMSHLARQMDFVLLSKVVSFGLASKDKPIDHSRDLSDLGRLTAGDNEVAQAYFAFRMIDLRNGERVLDIEVEGLESRRGTRLKYISYGWLGTIDLTADSFRRTTLGRATYKALGAFLYELYPRFKLSGEVLAASGDTVVVNLDSRAGIEVGDELTIFEALQILNDEGVPVYETERRLASAIVLELQPGRCLCLVLDGPLAMTEFARVRPLNERWRVPDETEIKP